MDKIRLIKPSLEMKKPAMAFRQEFIDHAELKITGGCNLERYDDYAAWLKRISGDSAGEIPSSVYFAFRREGNVIVGILDIRHYLTREQYKNGHISFSVRPSERRKRYGTEILRLALTRAHELGILEIYVSCDKHNAVCRKIFRANRLQKSDDYQEANGNIICVYSE